MAKFHINEKGEPGVCSAKVSCPYGDLNTQHYPSKEVARKAFELSLAGQTLKELGKISEKKTLHSLDVASSSVRTDDRIRAAINPTNSQENLDKLSQDEDPIVRGAVALNPAINSKIEKLLSLDKSSYVRSNLAQIVGLDPKTYITLEEGAFSLKNPNDIDVLKNLAKNPGTPSVVLNVLSTSSNSEVVEMVSKVPDLSVVAITNLVRNPQLDVKLNLFKNQNITRGHLSILSEDKSIYIRMKVAEHPKTSGWDLKQLSKDYNENVRQAVAMNKNTDEKTLLSMLNTPEELDEIKTKIKENLFNNRGIVIND